MWKGDTYFYSVGTLRTLANNYDRIYDGVNFVLDRIVTNPWELAEFKADFDIAWRNLPLRMQQIVWCDIRGDSEREIEMKGFYDVKRYKSMAYRRMAEHLNT